MNYIKKHKKQVLIISIILVVFILLLMLIHTFMPNSKKNAWGNRVSDIANHPISDEVINKVKEDLKATGKVDDVSYRLSIRTMNFIITLKDGVKRADAIKLSDTFLKDLSDDIKSYYDIELYFKLDGSEEYPFMGYKNKISSDFKYTYAGE